MIGTQANTQAVPVARYAVNKWIFDEIKQITTARRAASNDARYWPSNAANDANFAQSQAQTIISMEKVLKSQAANDSTFAITATDVVQAAAATTMAVAGAPVWLTTLISLGIVAIGNDLIFDTDPTVPASPKVNIRPVNTPAGVRIKKSIIGSSPVNQISSDAATSLVVSNGGAVIAESTCLSNSFCSKFPSRKLTDLTGWSFLTDVYSVQSSLEDNGQFTNPQYSTFYTVTKIPDVSAIFKNFSDLKSYLLSLPPFKYNGLLGFQKLYTKTSITPTNVTLYGPVSDIQLIRDTNVDYTQTTLRVELNDNIYYYKGFFDDFNTFVTSVRFQAQVISQLDAYGTNIGKISLGATESASIVQSSVMAGMLNKLWLKASQQPGYKGLPYTPTNPIAEPDLRPDPSKRPKLDDLLKEVLNPTGEIVISDDGLIPSPEVATEKAKDDPTFCQKNPTDSACKSNENNNDVDLSSPPAEEPKLADVPTAKSILQPLLDILPSYKNVSISHVAGVCPTASFDTEFGEPGGAYYRTWTIDHHCTMFEDFRAAIESIFLVIFAFASFRIVMKA